MIPYPRGDLAIRGFLLPFSLKEILMATRSRGGGGGMAVALVIFGILFVLGIITTMIFHNKWQESINARTEAEDKLEIYATASDIKGDPYLLERPGYVGEVR